MFSQALRSSLPKVRNLLYCPNLRIDENNAAVVSASLQHVQQNHRLFSQDMKLEEIAVDYDYVKKATQNKDTFIIDVREPDEVKEHGHIPNSINIPLGNVSTALGAMAEKDFQKIYRRPKPLEDTELIFYCMIGRRSGMALQNAVNIGYKNGKNYVGSWIDWASKQEKK